MKKSLIALAALAAVGAASAQSSVTLYGVLDVGYGAQSTTSRDGAARIRSSGVMDGANAGNRIGFRGTEDLGGGLKANFVVEQGISPTNGSLFGVRAAAAGHQISGFSAAGSAAALSGAAGAYSTATNRQSYIGLSSGIGTFNIGYQYTVLYELGTLSGYALGSEGVPGADKAHLHGQFVSGMGTRSNMIQYISPNFGGGFTARVQYGAGADRESFESTAAQAFTNGLTVDKARKFGLMLQYANGPLSLAAAYSNAKVTTNAGVAGVTLAPAPLNVYGGTVGAAGTTPLTGLNRSGNVFQVGGSYDFGVAKIGGTYNRGKGQSANAPTAASPVGTPGFDSTYRSYQIGVAVPFGAIVPFIAYGRATTDSNNINGTGPTLTAGATNRTEDYKQWQAGVRYSLSKRTTAYAFYGQTRNEAAALAGLTAAGAVTGNAFYKDSKTVVGIQHSF